MASVFCGLSLVAALRFTVEIVMSILLLVLDSLSDFSLTFAHFKFSDS